MSSPEKPKIEAKLQHVKIISLPPVRNYSTGGGHLPGDVLVEGDAKFVTKKWQGHPPVNLNIIGKPLTPLREVAEPRVTGTAEYTTRVVLPGMLYAKFLRCPHPRAMVKRLDTSKAEKMPGVHYVLTHRNAPSTCPMGVRPENPLGGIALGMQGDYVAIVAAESEDLAEDAVEAVEVEYEVLPFVPNLASAEAPGAPDISLAGQGNLLKLPKTHPNYHPNATAAWRHGDINKGFAESDIIKEFTYYFQGGRHPGMQPSACVSQWEGDKLTFWGFGQGIYPNRAALARWLGIPESDIRYINKYNGTTFGGTGLMGSGTGFPYWGHIAYISKLTGRPVKAVLGKHEDIAHLGHKPETVSNFKVGVKKDGRIHALKYEVRMIAGWIDAAPGHATGGSVINQLELHCARTPHWERITYAYKTNTPTIAMNRSYTQQEIKWAWEIMIDELAEALGMDPVKFRLINIARPGDKLNADHDASIARQPESVKRELTYDSFASVEVLEEAAKAFGWDKRNPKPAGMSGRFKRGMGMGMSQHHGGMVNYREGEKNFKRPTWRSWIEIDTDGYVIVRNALPDSGTNHGTGIVMLVAEMLGFTSLDKLRYVWGDTDTAPRSDSWRAGCANSCAGGAALVAAEKLKKDLLERASRSLGVDQSRLETRNGVIWSKEDPKKSVTFGELARAAGRPLRMEGAVDQLGGDARGISKGVGACFVEVEVDTWTGIFRVLRVVYSHDTGKTINPLVAEADMEGSFMQSYSLASWGIPWDKEFAGQRHYNMGFLSYGIQTIKEYPEDITNIFVESLEPRWFYGYKGFTETAIGCVPGAISNAIYNATGVRIRNHPISAEKIVTGLRTMGAV